MTASINQLANPICDVAHYLLCGTGSSLLTSIACLKVRCNDVCSIQYFIVQKINVNRTDRTRNINTYVSRIGLSKRSRKGVYNIVGGY